VCLVYNIEGMGSLKSFEKINYYLKESPERVFFRFTNTLGEEPLSEYEAKVSRGKADISYVSTPFGIYSYPFKYFFLDKSVKSLSNFFYLLSKGVVKKRVERGRVGYPSRTALAELGKGSALYAVQSSYIRFLVVSPNAKIWTIGENDPWIDGSKALDLYKEVLNINELTPIYEIIPLSVKRFSPLSSFFLFPYAIGKYIFSLVENEDIKDSFYDSFEDVVALVFKNPNQYRKNLESALRELLFSRYVEEHEFSSFFRWLKSLDNERKQIEGQSTDRLIRNLPFTLPIISFIISFYLSLNKVLSNKDSIGDKYSVKQEIENILYVNSSYSVSRSNPFLFFGYHRLLNVAKELQHSPETVVRERFLEVRKEIIEKVVRIVADYSKGQVLYLKRLISSLLNKIFNKYVEKKPGPSSIISLSLENKFFKGFMHEMMENLGNYISGFYRSINPFAHFLNELWEEGEETIRFFEERFINRLAGRSRSSSSYLYVHYEILENRNRKSQTIKYREVVLRLGFQVIVDPGYGLIHPNEPVQAVILDDSVLEYDDYFENFPYIYWYTLEELLSKIKISSKDLVDLWFTVIRSIEDIEKFGSKERTLSALISLYLDFSFLSKLLSRLGVSKEDQDGVKKALVYKMREISEKMESKAVKRVMSKSVLNFFLDKKSFPPEKMKKAFQEIKKVLSKESK
jgi:hypothetical protein